MLDIKGTFLKKDPNVKFLFLGILLLEITPVILSAIVSLSKNSIPVLLETVLSILFFISMFAFLTVYMSKRTWDGGQKQPVRWISGIVTGITVYMLIGVLILCISAALNATYGYIVTQPIGTSTVSISLIAGCTVAILLASLLLYSAIMLLVASFKFNIPPGRQWKAFLILTGNVFKRFPHSIIVLLTALAACAAVLFAVPYLAQFMERIFPNAFAAILIQMLIVTATETYIIYFLINAAERGMEKNHERLASRMTGQGENAGIAPKMGVP